MASGKLLSKILNDIYTELYANCTTPVAFDLLVAAAEINENGEKVIPYDDYAIDSDLFDEIVNKHLKKHRLSRSERSRIKWNVYLGCSPRTIQEDDTIEPTKKEALSVEIPVEYVVAETR